MTFSKLFEYIILCSQIYGRLIILFTKHDYKVLASFIKEKQRYKWLKKAKWISVYSVASKHTQKKPPKKKKKPRSAWRKLTTFGRTLTNYCPTDSNDYTHSDRTFLKKTKKAAKCLEKTHDFRQSFDELLSYRF